MKLSRGEARYWRFDCFKSHIVQMKHGVLYITYNAYHDFKSHIVQMKPKCSANDANKISSLNPT